MKKTFLLLFWGLQNFWAIGQNNYVPIPENNVYWRETSFFTVWLPNPTPVYSDYSLFVSGDTTIGVYTYKKLFQTGVTSSTMPPVIYFTNAYSGAFRQDSLIKKVFFISQLDSIEQLLYDFNLNIGDTLPPSFNNDVLNPNTQGNFVLDIDSVLVGNQLHKRLLLNPVIGGTGLIDTNYAIIEGVGSTFGFYHLIEPPFETGSQLICFNHNSSYYPVNSTCPFFVGESEPEFSNSSIVIYPNPFNEKVTLKFEKTLKNGAISIWSQVGQLLFVQSNIEGNSIELIRNNLPNGIFILELKEANELIWTGKVVIQDN